MSENMSSDNDTEFVQNSLENTRSSQDNNANHSIEISNGPQSSQDQLITSSFYTLASDGSLFAGDVDRWIHGSNNNTENITVQRSRVTVVQRSTPAQSSSLDSNGVWYMISLVLPLMTIQNSINWRCAPSLFLNTAEIFLAHLNRACVRVRAQMHHLIQDTVARDIFATAMDIVLVIYAIGFLVLSMYQASIIG